MASSFLDYLFSFPSLKTWTNRGKPVLEKKTFDQAEMKGIILKRMLTEGYSRACSHEDQVVRAYLSFQLRLVTPRC